MRKKLIFIWFFLLVSTVGFAQSTWIDFDQAYFKVATSEDGIHRITFTTLSASGINPSSIDPRNIRMFHRGQEVAIYVQGEQNGRFDPNDFIDFYGKRNDGELDKKLFPNPAHVGNIMYNQHNDSTAFFSPLVLHREKEWAQGPARQPAVRM